MSVCCLKKCFAPKMWACFWVCCPVKISVLFNPLFFLSTAVRFNTFSIAWFPINTEPRLGLTERDWPISTRGLDRPHLRPPTAQNHLLSVADEQITWLDRTVCEKPAESRFSHNATNSSRQLRLFFYSSRFSCYWIKGNLPGYGKL